MSKVSLKGLGPWDRSPSRLRQDNLRMLPKDHILVESMRGKKIRRAHLHRITSLRQIHNGTWEAIFKVGAKEEV
jgi:hypothetical protein